MTVIGHSAGLSDTGRRRRRNEDSFVLAPPLFAVADGMGGAQAGEVASRLAAAALQDQGLEGVRGAEGVAALIQEANRRVFSRAAEDPSASGMGTTITVALVEGHAVAIGHVGDSRAYLARGGDLSQLTDDHSLVNELMKSGKLSPEEAETHPQRSVITRALGTDPTVDVDAFTVDVEDGDVLLLCSDGLTSMVPDRTILDILERHRADLARATHALVDAANRGGGEDNITVVAFEIVPDTGGEPLEETREMAAPASPDEDTLTEADRVPAVEAGDTMVVPARAAAELTATQPQPLATRPTPPPEVRRIRWRVALATTLFLAVACGLLVWGLLR